MTDDPYDVILSSIVSDAEQYDAERQFQQLELAVNDYFRTHFPDDEAGRHTAALGIVLAGDADPSENWTRRIDGDVQDCNPSEVTEALAADVLISDGLGVA